VAAAGAKDRGSSIQRERHAAVASLIDATGQAAMSPISAAANRRNRACPMICRAVRNPQLIAWSRRTANPWRDRLIFWSARVTGGVAPSRDYLVST